MGDAPYGIETLAEAWTEVKRSKHVWQKGFRSVFNKGKKIIFFQKITIQVQGLIAKE